MKAKWPPPPTPTLKKSIESDLFNFLFLFFLFFFFWGGGRLKSHCHTKVFRFRHSWFHHFFKNIAAIVHALLVYTSNRIHWDWVSCLLSPTMTMAKRQQVNQVVAALSVFRECTWIVFRDYRFWEYRWHCLGRVSNEPQVYANRIARTEFTYRLNLCKFMET